MDGLAGLLFFPLGPPPGKIGKTGEYSVFFRHAVRKNHRPMGGGHVDENVEEKAQQNQEFDGVSAVGIA